MKQTKEHKKTRGNMTDIDINAIMRQVDREVDIDLTKKGVITLGKLISELKTRKQDSHVTFDFCGVTPGELTSYRGYYRMLAIEPDFECNPVKVKDFITKLKSAINKTFIGYKGGEFVMDKDTWMWVAQYGRSDGTAIFGVEGDEFETIIKTGHIGP